MNANRARNFLMAQLFGTIAIVAFVPSNLAKALMLVCWWLFTFQELHFEELIFYAAVCALFFVADILSVGHGVFAFNHPDILGLPYYEPLLWGFYVLHALRIVKPSVPAPSYLCAILLAVPFAAAFSFIADPQLLTVVSSAWLLVGLALFHEPADLALASYMVMLGAVFEYAGVWSGQWHYFHAPRGGVPYWFIALWGGVGLLARRLMLPTLAAYKAHRAHLAYSKSLAS